MNNPHTNNTTGYTESTASAYRIRFRGRLIWMPPKGKPFYVDRNPASNLNDEQLNTLLNNEPEWKPE